MANYGYHYFKVSRPETDITGVLSIQGTVAEISEVIKDITKKAGKDSTQIELEEITRETADKIQLVEG
jgi:hypothetical protein